MVRKIIYSLLLVSGALLNVPSYAQDPAQIVELSNDKLYGKSCQGEVKMTIIRPDWQREMHLKFWSLGTDRNLILVTSPDRYKGFAFLKLDWDMVMWEPSVKRAVIMPRPIMTQSWMGSDFTNDDLVRQSPLAEDFNYLMLNSETIEGYECYVIELIPREDSEMFWGKLIMWISKEEYMQMKTEFYNEEGSLVNTITGMNVRMIGGKLLPARLEVVPAYEEGYKTVLEYLDLKFDVEIPLVMFDANNFENLR